MYDFGESSVYGTAVSEVFSVKEVTNSVSGFYRIKLRAAVMNSEADTAQQELQPVVYTNVIGPRDWLLFQGPDILTMKLKQASTIWLLLPQTLLDFRRYFRILQPTYSQRNVQYVYHSLTEWVKFRYTTK